MQNYLLQRFVSFAEELVLLLEIQLEIPNSKELNHSLRLILSVGCSRSLLRLFEATFPSGSLSGDSLARPVFEWYLPDAAAGCTQHLPHPSPLPLLGRPKPVQRIRQPRAVSLCGP